MVATKVKRYSSLKGSPTASVASTPIRTNVSRRKTSNANASPSKNAGNNNKVPRKAQLQTRDAQNASSNSNTKNRSTNAGLSSSRGINVAQPSSTKRDNAPSTPPKSGARLTPVRSDSPSRKNLTNASSARRDGTLPSSPSGRRVGSLEAQARPSSRGRSSARPTSTDRVRSLSPARTRRMEGAPYRERRMEGMTSTKRVRSLSPARGRDISPLSNNGASTRRLYSENNEKSARVKMLMASHKLPVCIDPNFADGVEFFEEPMLRHVKLDDDMKERSLSYGNFSEEVQGRTTSGFHAFLEGDFDLAYHQYSITNDLKWEYYANKHEKAVDSIIRMSFVLEAQGKMKSAIMQKTGALDLYRALNVSKTKIIDTLISVGNSFFFREKYKDALTFYDEASTKLQEHSPAATDSIAYVKTRTGLAYAKLGKNRDAIVNFEDALQLQKCSATADEMDIAETLVGIGDVYLLNKGMRDASTKAYTEALSIYRSNGVRYNDPRMAALLSRLDGTVSSCDSRSFRSAEEEGTFDAFMDSCAPDNSCATVGVLAGAAGMGLLAFSRRGLSMAHYTSSGAVDKINEFMLFDGSCGSEEKDIENGQDDEKKGNSSDDKKEDNEEEENNEDQGDKTEEK